MAGKVIRTESVKKALLLELRVAKELMDTADRPEMWEQRVSTMRITVFSIAETLGIDLSEDGGTV